ncbi:MAG: hypothetical protein HY234_04995 [Acidobacteria bacterium]|nr:hypothetical protein [Acidobacteriota bacterium]
MNPPKYFVAVFGDPNPPNKDTVESGVYHPDPDCVPFPTRPGDVILLYCTGGYRDYAMASPGIGIVLKSGDQTIQYRYLALSKPIAIHDIKRKFHATDAEKFDNIRFSTFWLFEISRESFVGALGDRTVTWPGADRSTAVSDAMRLK